MHSAFPRSSFLKPCLNYDQARDKTEDGFIRLDLLEQRLGLSEAVENERCPASASSVPLPLWHVSADGGEGVTCVSAIS